VLTDLLAEIERQGGDEPIVSLELFFEGNDDLGSIGPNLIDHPGVAFIYATLRAVRDRPDVYGVWVGIDEVVADDEWPFTDHVYVVTSAPPSEVDRWVRDLQSDEPGDTGWLGGPPPVAVPDGARLVVLWWD
jgi:hypothetical protein